MACLFNSSYLIAKEESHAETTHDEHEGHDEHEEGKLEFSNAQLKEFAITLGQASSGVIHKTLDLAGEVLVDPQRLHHVSPQISGIVRKVFKHLGDTVKKGDLLATIASRDLADAKARLLTASSLLNLANATLKRERHLYQQQITAKRDYLVAQQAQAEISAKYQAEKQNLLALGLSQQAITAVLNRRDKKTGLYQLHAPANGIIIKQHLAQGEFFDRSATSFTIADLSKVWVNLTVYQKDLPVIQQGQEVWVSSRFNSKDKPLTTTGKVDWISPILDEQTRSAILRVRINNSRGYWRPGLFVNAKVTLEKVQAPIVIPESALQTIDNKTVVFVRHEDGDFEPQAVTIGRKDALQVEIVDGLQLGQTYVSQNAFTLKAQLQKGEFDTGHHH